MDDERDLSTAEARVIDMAQAHADGLHDEYPREFCPDCEAERGSKR